MTKKIAYLRLFAVFFAIGFLVLVSAPLITLAIPTTQMIAPSSVPTADPPEQNISPVVAAPVDNVAPVTPESQPEYDTYTYSERQQQNLPTSLPVSERYFGTKVVYLTFDDGPNPENTPIVLDLLRANNIKATFFVIGTEVEKYPTLLQRIYNEGHAIGNHSYNHIYRELYKSVQSYVGQLHHNDDLIKNVLNVRPHISRAPGGSVGSFTKEYWETLKNQGYIEVGWNISSGDASSAKADEIASNIIDQTERNKFLWSHAIVLMHDGKGHGETMKALPAIIKFFKEQGFEFRVVNSKTPSAW